MCAENDQLPRVVALEAGLLDDGLPDIHVVVLAVAHGQLGFRAAHDALLAVIVIAFAEPPGGMLTAARIDQVQGHRSCVWVDAPVTLAGVQHVVQLFDVGRLEPRIQRIGDVTA